MNITGWLSSEFPRSHNYNNANNVCNVNTNGTANNNNYWNSNGLAPDLMELSVARQAAKPRRQATPIVTPEYIIIHLWSSLDALLPCARGRKSK